MTAFFDMLKVALYAMLVQNMVFSTGFGISESIRMAKRPKHFFMYGACVTFFSLTCSLICYFVRKIPFVAELETRYLFLVNVIILLLVYLVTALICRFLLKADKKFMNSLSMCALNTLVIALPVLNFKAGYSLLQIIGTGIGAGLAFSLSMVLIGGGMKFVAKNKNIPEIFKGTPALLIYVSLIALAISCISGESLFL